MTMLSDDLAALEDSRDEALNRCEELERELGIARDELSEAEKRITACDKLAEQLETYAASSRESAAMWSDTDMVKARAVFNEIAETWAACASFVRMAVGDTKPSNYAKANSILDAAARASLAGAEVRT